MFKKFNFSRKAVEYSVLCGLLCAVFLSFAGFDAACEDLRTQVLRLHIIANSDSESDQALKIAVRDEILKKSGELFDSPDDLEKAVQKVQSNTQTFEKIARQVLLANGCEDEVSVCVGNSYFETRVYDDFTLPAGTYRSLIVKIGKAEGKNWWCVIFPQLCLPAAEKVSLADTVGERGAEIAGHAERYEMKFKSVEIYEDIRHFFTGK